MDADGTVVVPISLTRYASNGYANVHTSSVSHGVNTQTSVEKGGNGREE